MRTSAGFFVTGLCGKTRIQSLPLRLRWREIVTRAASICWPVIGPRLRDCRPNSPNESVLPRLALPARVPFIDLRYLVRAGARAMAVRFLIYDSRFMIWDPTGGDLWALPPIINLQS